MKVMFVFACAPSAYYLLSEFKIVEQIGLKLDILDFLQKLLITSDFQQYWFVSSLVFMRLRMNFSVHPVIFFTDSIKIRYGGLQPQVVDRIWFYLY
jgi:hypothetical protein